MWHHLLPSYVRRDGPPAYPCPEGRPPMYSGFPEIHYIEHMFDIQALKFSPTGDTICDIVHKACPMREFIVRCRPAWRKECSGISPVSTLPVQYELPGRQHMDHHWYLFSRCLAYWARLSASLRSLLNACHRHAATSRSDFNCLRRVSVQRAEKIPPLFVMLKRYCLSQCDTI